MTQLDRLLALVRRTGLPTIVPGENDAEGDCVLLSLEEYERLFREGVSARPLSPAFETGPPDSLEGASAGVTLNSLITFQDPPSVPSPSFQSPTTVFSLQDLIQPTAPTQQTKPLSAGSPQIESLDDRFSFDALDRRILPQ